MTKHQRVQLLEWNGTVESYNKIVDELFPRDFYQVDFMDDKFDRTNNFTDCFRVMFVDNLYPRNKEATKKEYELQGRNHDGISYKAPCVIPKTLEDLDE